MTTPAPAASGAFRQLPFMGVIRVNVEAMKLGYRMGGPAWCNLGQGEPEVGDLGGGPGYSTPDYTAYEDLLVTFHRLDPYWIELRPEDGFRIDPKDLDARVVREKLGALLISNPCNPTGAVIRGAELASWVEMARRRSCTLLMDEFYSHFVYAADQPGPV